MTNPVNLENLREMTDGDKKMEKLLFEEFFSSSEECIAIMKENCVDGENEPYRANSHALKGTAINLGAERLSELCKNSQESSAASSDEKKRMVAGIKQEYEEVKIFLQNALV
jgi:HPt (histidine-containing phosphotransfer) domain-containing protein